MRDVQIYLMQVYSDIPADADRTAFPLTLPFVGGLDIRFRAPVTFIVGENGSGKSTLLEALVDIAGLPVQGGGKNDLPDMISRETDFEANKTTKPTLCYNRGKMKRKTFWLLIAVLVSVRLVLMATMPVFEPSEARYAAISANMARSGDFVVPRFTHNCEYQSFDGKPPLVFQVGGLFCRAFGVTEFAVRLFPFLSAALLLVILFSTVRHFADAAAGRLAVLVCASCTAFYAAAGISMTDMTLACCVAGALLLYRRFLEDFGWGSAVGVAALLGAGMIVKGPVSLVMFGLPVLVDSAVNRRWRGLFCWKWLAVAPVFLAVAVPWFVLIEQRNPGAVWYFFYNENFLRFVSHDYGDKYGAGREAFRGVSVVWAFVATLPWALVPLWTSFRAFKSRRFGFSVIRSLDYFSLSLLTIVGFWCLTSRVLVYYLFPVVPLFAASLVLRGDRVRLARLAPWGAAVSSVALVGALVGGSLLSDSMQGAKTRFSPIENHYAYEFYHGTPPAAELRKCRLIFEERVRLRAARKAAAAAEKAGRKAER